jgi:hypothetical protein
MSEGAQAGRPPTAATNPSTTSYVATCLTHHSAADFEETRRRMDDRVPLLEPAATVELVLGDAPWSEVEAVVTRNRRPYRVGRPRAARLRRSPQPEGTYARFLTPPEQPLGNGDDWAVGAHVNEARGRPEFDPRTAAPYG